MIISFDDQSIYRVLKIIIVVVLIYLFMRYFPYTHYSDTKAMSITIIFTVLLIVLLVIRYQIDDLKEPTCDSSESCNSCYVDKFGNVQMEIEQEQMPTTESPSEEQQLNRPNQPPYDPSSQPRTNSLDPRPPHLRKIPQDVSIYDARNLCQMSAKNREQDEKNFLADVKFDMNQRARSTSGYGEPYQVPGCKSQKHLLNKFDRAIYGEIDNDMPYSDYNHLPMAAGYKSHDYEYGYSYLPPEKWYPQPAIPPICLTNRPSTVYESLANGTPADVKEFSRLTGPNNVSTNFVDDRMNSGR